MNKAKKAWYLAKNFLSKSKVKAMGGATALMAPMAASANSLLENQDITVLFMDSALGKTIGKTGMIWTVLIIVALLIASGKAVIANDPRKFIPAFIVAVIIASIVGLIIT